MPSIAGFDADHIRVAIKYLATGSTGGFSGITPRQLLELTACEEAYDDGGLQHALAGLAAKWARGLASTELREWIPGATLTAISKPNNDVPYPCRRNSPTTRVQIFIRRNTEMISKLLQAHQFDVSSSNGSDASIHAVRQLQANYGHDNSMGLLQLNF